MSMRAGMSRFVALFAAATVLTSCASWRGIANVPLPGGPGSESGSYTIYVQMPETLALNANSRVRVADVFVGRVRAIGLKNWIATLTLDLERASSYRRTPPRRSGRPACSAHSMWSWRRQPTHHRNY